MAREVGNRSIEAQCLGQLGNRVRDAGKFAEALPLSKQCLLLRHRNGEMREVCLAIGSLAYLYALSGDVPRDEYRFFDPSATSLFDVVNDLPGPLDWLSEADLDAFVESFGHHGTFFGGINWYRNIDRSRELLAPFAGVQVRQPALFIGAEFDSIFGQTEEAVLATRASVPNLLDPIWVAGSGHWIQQEEPEIVNAALLDFLGSLPD